MVRLKVFLTGASGTVGSGVLEALAATGNYEIFCLARTPGSATAIASRGGQPILGDMGDDTLFDRLRDGGRYDFIIHAAQAHYREFSRKHIDELERRAVHNLEKLSGENTRLMIFTSGVWSYGTGAGGRPITEDTPYRPFNSAQKRAGLLRELTQDRDAPWTVLCPPSMVYGSVGPLAEIGRTFRNGGSVDVLDDSGVEWSVVERLDLGRAYEALMRQGKPRDHFVVAEDQPVRVIDFYETIAAEIGSGRVIRKPLAHFAADGDDDRLERLRTSQPIDATRFKKRTDWRARESFALWTKKFLGGG